MNRCGHVKCRKLRCVLWNKEQRNCIWQQPLEEVWGKGLREFATSVRSGQAKTLFWIQWFWGVGMEEGSVPPDLDTQMDA